MGGLPESANTLAAILGAIIAMLGGLWIVFAPLKQKDQGKSQGVDAQGVAGPLSMQDMYPPTPPPHDTLIAALRVPAPSFRIRFSDPRVRPVGKAT
jgi:hypothetical protein